MSDGSPRTAGLSTHEVRLRAVQAVRDEGLTVTEAARLYGTDRSTLHRWLSRFDAEGEDGLCRRAIPGRPKLLGQVDRDALAAIVMSSASEYGGETDFWTAPHLRQAIQAELDIAISKQTLMRHLQEVGVSLDKPGSEALTITRAARADWCRREAPRIRHAVREYRAILYFLDESNVHLPALFGDPAPKRRKVIRPDSVSALSAVASGGELIFWLQDRRVTASDVVEFLAQMLCHHHRRRLVVVMDPARPHVSRKLQTYVENQSRLHVFHTPIYQPDAKSAARAWNKLNHQETSGRKANTKEGLTLPADPKQPIIPLSPESLQSLFFRCCMVDVLGH